MPPTVVIGLIAGGDTALRNPVENAEDDMSRGWEELLQHHIKSEDTVIGIAASGTTPYVIGAMRTAREHGILTGCITSNPNSPMAAEADVPIEVIVGGVCDRKFANEIRYCSKDDSEYDQHYYHD